MQLCSGWPDGGHSVGCKINNAKVEHHKNTDHPANGFGLLGTADNCGTHSVVEESASRAAPEEVSTEGTVSGHISQGRQG